MMFSGCPWHCAAAGNAVRTKLNSLLSKNTYLKVKVQCIDKFIKLITCLEAFLVTGMNSHVFVYGKLSK